MYQGDYSGGPTILGSTKDALNGTPFRAEGEGLETELVLKSGQRSSRTTLAQSHPNVLISVPHSSDTAPKRTPSTTDFT